MSNVQVFLHNEDGSEDWIGNLPGDVLKSHSKLFRELIASKDTPEVIYRIAVTGPEFNAIRFVLQEVDAAAVKKQDLAINLGARGISAALRIHRAIKCLKIEPEQDGVVNHIQVLLTTTLVTRDQMIAVYLAYSGANNPHQKLYEMMIQTTAYKIVNDDKVKPAQKKQLFEASQTQPDLFAALNAKIDQLKASKKFRGLDEEQKQAAKQGKRDNRKERRKADQEKKRRAAQEGKVARRLAREEFERDQAEAWKDITEGVEGL
jgi:hypothetical protein